LATQDALANTKFVHEKKIIGRFFDHIARDTGEFCFGINETNNALELGAVELLIVWEELPWLRCVMKTSAGDNKVVYLKKEQLVDEAHVKDENGVRVVPACLPARPPARQPAVGKREN
jgi:peptide chain release factor subunit 1